MSRGAALLVVCAVAASVVAVPLFRGEVFTFRDHADYFQPLRFYTAEHLRELRLPLWNPYSASGEPWLANPQTGVFYPPTWLFALLPFERAYMLYLALHLALLGCGAFVLFARFARTGAAFAGAVAVVLCGPTLSMLDIQNNLATLAWLPWVIASAADCRRSGTQQFSAAIFLALSFLAGEPFLAALTAIVCAVIVRRLRDVAVIGFTALGLTAVQLLPFVEMLAGSDRRAGMEAGDVLRESMPLREWLRLVTPPSLTDAPPQQQYIPVVYTGAVVSLLAIAGIAVLIRRRAWGWLALALGTVTASMLIAAGPRLIANLPLTPLRYPARVVPLAAFALVALAVVALDRMRVAAWIDLAVAAVMVAELAAASAMLLESGPWRRDRVPFPRAFGRDAKILRLGAGPAALGAARDAWIAGYLNLYEGRFDAWTAAPVMSQRYLDLYRRALASPESAQRMSIGYVLSSRPLPPERFQPLGRAGGVFGYRAAGGFPLAYLVTEHEAIGAELLAFGPTHANITIGSARGGILVVTQNDARGWSVTVDGDAAEKRIDRGIFRAVAVPPGRHSVLWTYDPPSLRAGALVTFITLGVVAVVKFVKRPARKNFFERAKKVVETFREVSSRIASPSNTRSESQW